MKKYLDTQARFLGETPTPGGRRIAGWEVSFIVFVGAFVWAAYEYVRQPSAAPIYDWARDEAEERLRRRLQGLPVEFGYNYAALRAISETSGGEERE